MRALTTQESPDFSHGECQLIISGDTKNEITNKTYSVNSRFSINADEIKGIEWYVKDGLVIVEIEFKKPEKPKIEIKYKN